MRQQNSGTLYSSPPHGPVLRCVTMYGNMCDGQDPAGGYVFVTWIGDHSPYHVHVYRDRELVLKWDLENDVPMKGEASRRLLDLIEELRKEGLL